MAVILDDTPTEDPININRALARIAIAENEKKRELPDACGCGLMFGGEVAIHMLAGNYPPMCCDCFTKTLTEMEHRD